MRKSTFELWLTAVRISRFFFEVDLFMRIFLAPMEGVVDYHMRRLLCGITNGDHTAGVDVCVTEFIRVNTHLLPKRVFLRSCPELEQPAARPVRVQLLGSDPQSLAANARKAAELGAPAIDLNFGCPAKTVNKNRGGACLLNETDLLYEIVDAVRHAVPRDIPVTAKIRLGYENRNPYLQNAAAIAAAGANELIVHARSKNDGYRPPAYWEYIAEIRQALSIPVIANGEIWSIEDYLRCRDITGCDDVMLGRGLLAKPDLALQIKAWQNGRGYTPLPWRVIAGYLCDFFNDTCATYPNKFLGNRLKQWLHYLQRTYPQSVPLFHDIKASRDGQFISSRLQQEVR